MKFLFASDSFKGTLSSQHIIELLTKALHEVMPEATCVGLPVADGGEGTTESVVCGCGGELRTYTCLDPLGKDVEGMYGHLSEHSALFEMATVSGLPLLEESERNPLLTSSYGTGQMLGYLMDEGYTDIAIAIGGSATNDGGIGALKSLGIRCVDKNGNVLTGTGQDLEKISDIDISRMTPLIKDTKLTILCDVTNPLTGKNGATYTFGKQKGGTPVTLDRLEKGMENYRTVIQTKYGIDPNTIQGSGAAGGLGAALSIFLHGKMKSGVETILDLIQFDSYLSDVDYVITGEGRSDWQSCYGKVVQGVARRAKQRGIPVIDLCGSLGEGYEDLQKDGVTQFITTSKNHELNYALEHAEQLYYESALQLFQNIKNAK